MKNAHGDVLGAYAGNGITKVADYTYDAWGNQTSASFSWWADENPVRYAGEYYDTESGLIYLRARYYDSSMGRFLSEDPIKDGVNWYAYCGNNPIMFVDPWGLARQLRELVGETTGFVKWNARNSTATVNIDGQKQDYVVKDGLVYSNNVQVGYMENDSIMVEEADFNKDFNIVGTVTIAAYYSSDEELIYDVSGVLVRIDAFSGHSYIEYTPLGGSTDTYGTHPDYDQYGTSAGMYKNFEPDRNLMNDINTAKFSKKITRNQKSKMDKVINNSKNDTWSEWNNCTPFATKVFRAATGINIEARTPKVLKSNILELNHLYGN